MVLVIVITIISNENSFFHLIFFCGIHDTFFSRIFMNLHSKKCLVKYNPALDKIGKNPAIGLFLTHRSGYCPEGWVKHLAQLLVENNPIAGFVHSSTSKKY